MSHAKDGPYVTAVLTCARSEWLEEDEQNFHGVGARHPPPDHLTLTAQYPCDHLVRHLPMLEPRGLHVLTVLLNGVVAGRTFIQTVPLANALEETGLH